MKKIVSILALVALAFGAAKAQADGMAKSVEILSPTPTYVTSEWRPVVPQFITASFDPNRPVKWQHVFVVGILLGHDRPLFDENGRSVSYCPTPWHTMVGQMLHPDTCSPTFRELYTVPDPSKVPIFKTPVEIDVIHLCNTSAGTACL